MRSLLAGVIFFGLILHALAVGQTAFVIEDEFKRVSCSSVIKLAHKTGCRLHSHAITYGTGSGQQAVTCNPAADNTDDYFWVQTGLGSPSCKRGQEIPCNSIVRLMHLNTKKYLHSHAGHASPFTRNQEVSAFDGTDKGDNWKVICVDKNDKFWTRESPIRLVHEETGKYLSASPQHVYRVNPPGQVEVSGLGSASSDDIWTAQEGIYFSAPE
ncbi:hypothetical protein SpCBS45565_g07876 [Spizellomyces sp. 'palustris']|nr:hypothetical protein SpCBS45565_g07876 [Spizellomyces sp. 'palustris']